MNEQGLICDENNLPGRYASLCAGAGTDGDVHGGKNEDGEIICRNYGRITSLTPKPVKKPLRDNEPLTGREFVRDTARLVREYGLLNVLVTNRYCLAEGARRAAALDRCHEY